MFGCAIVITTMRTPQKITEKLSLISAISSETRYTSKIRIACLKYTCFASMLDQKILSIYIPEYLCFPLSDGYHGFINALMVLQLRPNDYMIHSWRRKANMIETSSQDPVTHQSMH